MSDVQKDVMDFHEKFKQPMPDEPDFNPDDGVIQFRIDRIREEADEVIEALEARDWAAVANECVDLVYVAVGTLIALGIPFRTTWRLVHKANMAKTYIPPKDGVAQKPGKPEGWRKPIHDIREWLGVA